MSAKHDDGLPRDGRSGPVNIHCRHNECAAAVLCVVGEEIDVEVGAAFRKVRGIRFHVGGAQLSHKLPS